MSDASVPNDARPNGDVPEIDELERNAILARFRRAPRLGRVIGTGIAFGAGLGLALGFLLPNSTGVYRGTVAVLVGLGFAMIGGLAAGAIATRMDHATVYRGPQTDADAQPNERTD